MQFTSEEFGEVRAVVIDGEPWLVGSDVATMLGYTNPWKAVRDHVDDDDKLTERIGRQGLRRWVVLINESGVYSLIMQSHVAKAREFKRWITHEVLPAIRQRGVYVAGRCEPTEVGQAMAAAWRTLDEVARKAIYCERVLTSPSCYTMTQVAKGLSMTVGELTRMLRQSRVIYRSPSGPYMLYAPFLKRGFEAYRTRTGDDLTGRVAWSSSYLVWTERGREFISGLMNVELNGRAKGRDVKLCVAE